jgi:hypothetical protein
MIFYIGRDAVALSGYVKLQSWNAISI